MYERSLNFMEKLNVDNSVNNFVQFECHGLNYNTLKDAIVFLRQKYQYLRLKIIRKEAEFVYQEDVNEEILSPNFESNRLDSLDELKHSHQRFLIFLGKNRDLTNGQLYIEHYYYGSFHEIHLSSNNSGSDLYSNWLILKELNSNLENILSNVLNEPVNRPYLEIHDKIKNSYSFDQLIDIDIYENEFKISHCVKNEKIEEIYENNKYMVEFYKFDETTTQKLIKNCENFKCSIQSISSLASTIALVNEKVKLQDLDESVEVLNSIGCDIRECFQLDSEDVANTTTNLSWLQKISKNDDLWKKAFEISEKIKNLKNSYYGKINWLRCFNRLRVTEYDHLNTFLEDFNFENNNVKILDFGVSFSQPYNSISKFSLLNKKKKDHHMFSFLLNKRLNLNFCYCYHELGRKWAQNFLNNYVKILSFFTNDNIFAKDVCSILDKYQS